MRLLSLTSGLQVLLCTIPAGAGMRTVSVQLGAFRILSFHPRLSLSLSHMHMRRRANQQRHRHDDVQYPDHQLHRLDSGFLSRSVRLSRSGSAWVCMCMTSPLACLCVSLQAAVH